VVTSRPGIVKQAAHILLTLRLNGHEAVDCGQLLAEEVELA
jgi:hypothetical protein